MTTEIPRMLDSAPPAVRAAFKHHALLKHLPTGAQLTLQGESCSHFPLVQSGVIRVYTIGAKGQEMTLYRIQENEGCVLTLTCMINVSRFPAYAAVEQDCTAFLIPSRIFRQWVTDHDVWREFAFTYMTRVITNVIGLVEEVAFKKIDLRIAEFLVQQHLHGNTVIRATHQEIAREVGTVREVVSRELKAFEKKGRIALGRREIRILNLSALQSDIRLL